MPKVGVVLSGCGFLDGSEIHEATLTLYFLDRAGAEIVCMAPNMQVAEPIDYYHKKPSRQALNVLAESARIARTEITPTSEVDPNELDALVFPGGFGAAKNLCTWADNGPDCEVHPDIERLVGELFATQKPMGFVCIAPVIAARLLGSKGVMLTIGNDPATAAAIGQTGAKHVECPVDQAIADETHRIVCTPAYMLGPSIAPVALGIEALVNKLLEWA